jgi:zinc protease
MNLLKSCFLALLFLLASPLQAAGDADWLYRGSDIERDPAWKFGTLPNGVRYAVRQNKLPAGQVSIRVRIAAGGLHEGDAEQGWAHLTEHMAFRATKSFAEREARHLWQQLGASFGSDTNASTTATHTVYQLDLPHADRSSLDKSLSIIAEMVDSALFEPAAVEAERKIVLAEKGRRPELSTKMEELSKPLYYAGLKFAERNVIGTDATLNAATPEALRAFYERWYRPDRATIVIAGDADPAMLEQLVIDHFSGWQSSGPAPAEPDYGRIADVQQRVAALAYPGAPHFAGVMWLRPYERLTHTRAREKQDLAETLAERIVNRRLEAKARGDAAFVSAGITAYRSTHVAGFTNLAVNAREGRWQEALRQSFAIVNDAAATPPSQAEIERELQNLRTGGLAAVEGEATTRSPQRVQSIITAADGGNVVTTAATALKLLKEIAPQMTPAVVGAKMREIFQGAGPRMMLLSPQPVAGAPAVLEAALASAEKAAPATRMADRKVSLDSLPPLGPPGKEVSRQHIADLGVTIVRFANGSTLTFKQTDYEKGSVSVLLRFGEGRAGLPAREMPLGWTSGMVVPSGMADLDWDGIERLLTGRRMSMAFGAGDDEFVLSGQTNGTELSDQLRLLTTKLAYPRWDTALFNRMKSGILSIYDLSFASASARFAREFGAVTHRGDPRWSPVPKEAIAKADPAEFISFFKPVLGTRPIQATIVGDVDLETAVAAMTRTVAALPAAKPAPEPVGVEAVLPPAPDPRPKTFTHEGDKDEAHAVIGWSTFGGTGRIKERRALSLAANIFQVRLFERLREEEGASYSPSAGATSSDSFPNWGLFYAATEIRPESADTFFRIAREIVADLAAKPVPADEFERARNPVVSGIERRLKTNGYWAGVLDDWPERPELIEQTRSYLSDYSGMTAEDVRAAVARHVAEEGDWSMLVVPATAKAGGN